MTEGGAVVQADDAVTVNAELEERMRELGGLGEAPAHQFARRAEDPSVDEFVVVHWFSRSCG